VDVIHRGKVFTVHGVRVIRVIGGARSDMVDVLSGISAQVLVNDSAGSNTYTISGGSTSAMNEVVLGDGNDNVNTSAAPAGAAYMVRGGDGSNRIETGAGNDTIYGGKGQDIILAGAGADTVFTGTGTSHVLLDPGSVELSPDRRVTRMYTTAGASGADSLTGAASGTVYVIGGGGADVIRTGSGNDVIVGDEGEVRFDGATPVLVSTRNGSIGGGDVLEGGAGNDVVAGGAGADRISIGTGTSIVLAGNGSVMLGAMRTLSGVMGGGAVDVTIAAGVVSVDETLLADTMAVTAAANLVVNRAVLADGPWAISLESTTGNVSLAATEGGSGSLSIRAAGNIVAAGLHSGVRVARAQSLGGSVTLSGVGAMMVESATSKAKASTMKTGWDIGITSVGDLILGLVQAPGASITLSSGGAIEELGVDDASDITARTLTIEAAGGIGSKGALESMVGSLSATSATGPIRLANLAALTVTLARTSSDVGGDIELSSRGGALRVQEATASGTGATVRLSTLSSGDIHVGTVLAGKGKIEAVSAGFIKALVTKPDDEYHLVATSVTLTAALVDAGVKWLEVPANLRSLGAIPDLRVHLGTGWTERQWNGLSGSGATHRFASLGTAMASKPAGDSVRLWQTGVTTPNVSVSDNFGSVASGWLRASAAGDYHFWTAADDNVELRIFDASGNAMGGGPVSSSGYVSPGSWNSQSRSAAIRLEANTFYRFEVRFLEFAGGEYFRVGYSTAANGSAPQAILGASTPLATGASTPISVVPDFAGQWVTVRLATGAGGLIDVSNAGVVDKTASVGGTIIPDLTLQGDRTGTVTLTGSFASILSFLATSPISYSAVGNDTLKITLSTPSMTIVGANSQAGTRTFTMEVPSSFSPPLSAGSTVIRQRVVWALSDAGDGLGGSWLGASKAGDVQTLRGRWRGFLQDTLGKALVTEGAKPCATDALEWHAAALE
jgi:hypothetical protein